MLFTLHDTRQSGLNQHKRHARDNLCFAPIMVNRSSPSIKTELQYLTNYSRTTCGGAHCEQVHKCTYPSQDSHVFHFFQNPQSRTLLRWTSHTQGSRLDSESQMRLTGAGFGPLSNRSTSMPAGLDRRFVQCCRRNSASPSRNVRSVGKTCLC